MAKKVRFRRQVKSSEKDLWEILNRPPRDPEHKQMRAWYKREKQYGRLYPGNAYVDWLEQQFGPIENAKDSWLTETTDE